MPTGDLPQVEVWSPGFSRAERGKFDAGSKIVAFGRLKPGLQTIGNIHSRVIVSSKFNSTRATVVHAACSLPDSAASCSPKSCLRRCISEVFGVRARQSRK